PGFIAQCSAILAEKGINIATFHLGRTEKGGDAVCLISIDETLPEAALAAIRALPQVMQATQISF
ncbi:MAG: hypothetical protein B7Z59_07020, partial [Acidiphilium sp. 37-67-22]